MFVNMILSLRRAVSNWSTTPNDNVSSDSCDFYSFSKNDILKQTEIEYIATELVLGPHDRTSLLLHLRCHLTLSTGRKLRYDVDDRETDGISHDAHSGTIGDDDCPEHQSHCRTVYGADIGTDCQSNGCTEFGTE